MRNMKAKNGDHVINWNEDESMVHFGIVSDANEEDNECDLDFYGGGSVSPVGLSDCIVVPENLCRWLDKVTATLPQDSEGVLRLPEDIEASSVAE